MSGDTGDLLALDVSLVVFFTVLCVGDLAGRGDLADGGGGDRVVTGGLGTTFGFFFARLTTGFIPTPSTVIEHPTYDGIGMYGRR